MVYNAMKLFMEINPQLFDDCSHDYTELQSTADQRQQARQEKWDQLAEQAKLHKRNGQPSTLAKASQNMAPIRADEVDPVTQDNQKRLDALKIQDEGSNNRDQRRPKDHERKNSVRMNCFIVNSQQTPPNHLSVIY